MKFVTPYRIAILCMLVSTTLYSTSGLIERNLTSIGDWQTVFWRGLFMALSVCSILIWQHGYASIKVVRDVGTLGFLAGFFYAGATIGFILALKNTTVANTVFTLSVLPFFTALLAWLFLGERLHKITLVAIAIATIGIGLMVGDSLSTGAIYGNLLALGVVVSFSFFVIVLRFKRHINMLPATAIGSAISALVGFICMGADFAITLHDLILCFIWGAGISGFGHVLIVIASRQLMGAELTLLLLIEFTLAPLWVWLFVNEVPAKLSLIGGAVVLTAVAANTWLTVKKTYSDLP